MVLEQVEHIITKLLLPVNIELKKYFDHNKIFRCIYKRNLYIVCYQKLSKSKLVQVTKHTKCKTRQKHLPSGPVIRIKFVSFCFKNKTIFLQRFNKKLTVGVKPLPTTGKGVSIRWSYSHRKCLYFKLQNIIYKWQSFFQ